MPIDKNLRHFIEGPVMLIVGSVDGEGRTTIGRASGAHVDGADSVTLYLSIAMAMAGHHRQLAGQSTTVFN